MANRIQIATFSIRPFEISLDDSNETITNACIDFWKRKLDKIMLDEPNLVVLPECANRPLQFQDIRLKERIIDYYDFFGDRLSGLCKDYAQNSNTVFVFAQDGRLEDGRMYNCSKVIGPDGTELGRYCKNHLVIAENTELDVVYGEKAELIQTPFGKIACALCFDLNFETLRKKYEKSKPDLLVFSSMYHGGLQQSIWAYLCQCHFVGSMGLEKLPAEIRNPFGEVLYTTTNYFDSVIGEVNLDCVMVHLDYHYGKLDALKAKYKSEVNIYDPGLFGTVLITSESKTVSAIQMANEFEIQLLDDYLEDARRHRAKNL